MSKRTAKWDKNGKIIKTPAGPTTSQSAAFEGIFAYMNRELFGDSLTPCMLTFSRHSKAMGFFVPNVWADAGEGKAHEIALNPDFLDRPAIDAVDTIVHEMVHLWQEEHGTPPRRCYHDKEWAAKMESIGLIPSDTGAPGGKRTGQKMSDYVAERGPFAVAFAAMPAELLLPWRTIGRVGNKDREKKKKRASKSKYVCPSCEANVWGKPGLNVNCGDCDEAFELVEPTGGES